MKRNESPAERTLRARAAAYNSWANTEDRTARTAAGVKAFNDRFEKQVDPDGKLTPQERATRAGYARRAYFAELSRKSAQARRIRKTLTEKDPTGRGGVAS